MNVVFHRRAWAALAILALAGGVRRASAQARYMDRYIEPRWLTLDITEVSAGVYAEGTFDRSTYTQDNTAVSHENLFVGPSLGLIAHGSVYHPNLVTYSFNSDGAFGYSHDSFKSGVGATQNQYEYLGNFAADLELLPNKPYNAAVFADYDHTYRDNDFFNRVTVDSWRWGARAGWKPDGWSINANYFHRDEESTSPYQVNNLIVDQTMVTHEDSAAFSVRQERSQGGSSLNYSLDRYTRSQGTQLGEGTDQTVAVGDSERFGSRDQYRLNSGLSFSRRDTTYEPENNFLGNVSLGIEHRPTLHSAYDFNYERYETTGYASDNYTGTASLTHQLYDSLSSTFSVRGLDTENSGDNLSGYTRRYGGGIAEAYTKRIIDALRIRVNNSVFVDHTDQQALGMVENERHSLNEGGAASPDSFYLAAPRVIQSTIVITDSRGVQQYQAGFDYQVFIEGSRTRIQWLTPAGAIKPSSVLASYQSEPTPEGGYDTMTEAFQVRLELWKNLWGLYGRLNLALNNAPSELHIQDFTSYAFGTDLAWRWFRAGAEYEIYHSTDSDYNVVRLFQSAALHADAISTFSLDLNETWIDYVSNHSREEDFRFITRYQRALTDRLRFDFEGGVAWRSGLGIDQVLAAVRPTLRYVIGKTSIGLSYDYEYNLYLDNQERQKHMFYLRLRRVF